MNEQQYQSLTSWVRRSPVQLRLVTALCRLLPLSLFVLYGLVSVYLWFCVGQHLSQALERSPPL